MDLQNMDLKGGSLQISTEVIGKIARCAALEVDGVSEVSCGKQNKKVKELLAGIRYFVHIILHLFRIVRMLAQQCRKTQNRV